METWQWFDHLAMLDIIIANSTVIFFLACVIKLHIWEGIYNHRYFLLWILGLLILILSWLIFYIVVICFFILIVLLIIIFIFIVFILAILIINVIIIILIVIIFISIIIRWISGILILVWVVLRIAIHHWIDFHLLVWTRYPDSSIILHVYSCSTRKNYILLSIVPLIVITLVVILLIWTILLVLTSLSIIVSNVGSIIDSNIFICLVLGIISRCWIVNYYVRSTKLWDIYS